MADLTPFRKRLVVVRYDKKKFGVGFNGGPGIWFIKDRNNCNLSEEDGLLWANIIAAYNEKVKEETL